MRLALLEVEALRLQKGAPHLVMRCRGGAFIAQKLRQVAGRVNAGQQRVQAFETALAVARQAALAAAERCGVADFAGHDGPGDAQAEGAVQRPPVLALPECGVFRAGRLQAPAIGAAAGEIGHVDAVFEHVLHRRGGEAGVAENDDLVDVQGRRFVQQFPVLAHQQALPGAGHGGALFGQVESSHVSLPPCAGVMACTVSGCVAGGKAACGRGALSGRVSSRAAPLRWWRRKNRSPR